MDEKTLKARYPNAKGTYPEFKICCMECNDTRFRLGFNVLKEVGHCFNCGFKVGPSQFKELLGGEFGSYSRNDFESAEEELTSLSAPKPPPELARELVVPGFKMSQVRSTVSGYYHNMYWRTDNYLRYRGFDPVELADLYKLIIPEESFFSGPRLVIPTFESGQMVFYQARSLNNSVPKYLNPPKNFGGVGKNNFVFNLDAVDPNDELIICEGVFSAMATGTSAVAVFGKEISQAQRVKILRRGFTKAVILFDPGAIKSAVKAGNSLRDALEVRVADLQKGDPNEVEPDYLSYTLAKARPLEDLCLLGLD